MGTTLAGIVDPHIRSIVRESCILSSLSFSLFSLFQFMSWRFDRGHPDNKMSFIFFKQYNIYCILEYYNILFSIFKLFKLILKRVDRNCVLNLIFSNILDLFLENNFFSTILTRPIGKRNKRIRSSIFHRPICTWETKWNEF